MSGEHILKYAYDMWKKTNSLDCKIVLKDSDTYLSCCNIIPWLAEEGYIIRNSDTFDERITDILDSEMTADFTITDKGLSYVKHNLL